MENNAPKGIGFYNIKSGETRYAQLEAQIQAYINSSDIGINASRDQDFGWRLSPEWVKAVKAFRRDEPKMALLVSKNGGQKVTTVQILYSIYGEQLRAAAERAEENENPFEEEYLQSISSRAEAAKPEPAVESVDEDDLKEPTEGTTVTVKDDVLTVPEGDGETSTKSDKKSSNKASKQDR